MNAKFGLALLVALLPLVASPARAQLSISRFVVAAGGATRSSGSNFGVGGTIGQPDAARSTGGAFTLTAGFWVGGGAVSAVSDDDGGIGQPDEPTAVPLVFRALPATPNPMGDGMELAFELPESREVRIEVYDAAGRLVRTIAHERVAAGRNLRTWDRRDQSGARVPGGIYFLRLSARPDERNQKLVVLP